MCAISQNSCVAPNLQYHWLVCRGLCKTTTHLPVICHYKEQGYQCRKLQYNVELNRNFN